MLFLCKQNKAPPLVITHTPHPLYRTETSWHVCMCFHIFLMKNSFNNTHFQTDYLQYFFSSFLSSFVSSRGGHGMDIGMFGLKMSIQPRLIYRDLFVNFRPSVWTD
jgi:hypothetical protein